MAKTLTTNAESLSAIANLAFGVGFRSVADSAELSDVNFSEPAEGSATLASLDQLASFSAQLAANSQSKLAIQATADLSVDKAGLYTFLATSDDGFSVSIDGTVPQMAADSGGLSTVALYLEPGIHSLSLSYLQVSGRAPFDLEWVGPDTNGLRQTLVEEPSGIILASVESDAPVAAANPDPGGSQLISAGVGNDNPTLAFNLTSVRDWSTELPFIDIARTMRPFFGNEPGGWANMSNSQLKAGGFLDDNGWLKEIPPGIEKVGTIWGWNGTGSKDDYRNGIYELTYDGTGSISLLSGRIISQEAGKITFEYTGGGNLALFITKTDPAKTGDYIRNISVVKEEFVELHEAGALFNPDWLEIVADARQFRFMDWMNTNGSKLSSWADRPEAGDATWSAGVPVEVMVRLANEAGVDPWFTMPHLADEDYIRNFAAYVRDNLDPALTARVEYSNEMWNFAFTQTQWVADKAKAEWGSNDWFAYHAKLATQTAVIWDDVFSQSVDAPGLVNVLGVQAVNSWLAEQMLTGATWLRMEPDTFVRPYEVFDEIAMTSYFGDATISGTSLRSELIQMIQDPNVDAKAWYAAKLMDPDYPQSIPKVATKWAEMRAIADKYGIDLVGYEGGQHVFHSFAVSGLTPEDLTILTNFMTEFVRSQEMADLYSELWDVWATIADGPFMQFGDVGSSNKSGAWAILDSLDDSTPRADFLFEKNATTTPWWDATPNEAYLQGLTLQGTAGDDLMLGTDQEDYLAGSKGNDIFIVGLGKDGINGGEGIDQLILTGMPIDYFISKDGDGFVIDGPTGRKFVINLEQFKFVDDSILSLDQFIDVAKAGGQYSDTLLIDGWPTDKIDKSLSYKTLGVLIQANADTETVPGMEPMLKEGDYSVYLLENPNASPTAGLDVSAAGLLKPTVQVSDVVFGTDGIRATNFSDVFVGQATDETVYGKGGNDNLDGQGGKDRLYGGYGADVLSGGEGADRLHGGKGHDVMSGGVGKDALFGGVGHDTIMGDDGNDDLRGWTGDDYLYGGTGNDQLRGGSGDDHLFGGDGQDTLNGADGNDILFGGEGDDTFYFKAGSAKDTISDFEPADRVVLDGFLADQQTLAEALSFDELGNAVLSNGTDQITFLNVSDIDLDTMVTVV